MKRYVLLAMAMLLWPGLGEAFTTAGFQSPYGVVVDSKTNFIYVSNVNGPLSGRDDNGFVSRLKGDGTVDQLRFIDGASKDTELHAPTGMAIVGTTLYVADIDRLRAFDITTGRFLFDVNFGDLPVQHFFDISPGPDDALYVTDGPANVVWRVDVPRLHEVTAFVSGDVLGQPHGICWSPAKQVFAVAGWNSGQVIAFDRSGKRQALPSIFLRALEGMTADDSGNLYVASTALAGVYRIAANFTLFSFGMGLPSPSGVAYQRSGNAVIIASFDAGTVQSIPVPLN
jgi:DNA-binding beta-propeller fold protein YncE